MYRENPELRVRLLPAVNERVETGAIQFGGDWPGTFVRGDDSYHLRLMLEACLHELRQNPKQHSLLIRSLDGFLQVFDQCNLNEPVRIRKSPDPFITRKLMPATEIFGKEPHNQGSRAADGGDLSWNRL